MPVAARFTECGIIIAFYQHHRRSRSGYFEY